MLVGLLRFVDYSLVAVVLVNHVLSTKFELGACWKQKLNWFNSDER